MEKPSSPVTECIERKVWCGRCQRLVDRDENAALNIVMSGLWFSLKGVVSEAMQNQLEKPSVQVDATQLINNKIGRT